MQASTIEAMESKDRKENAINSAVVVATLIAKLQELLARAVECAIQTPDNFFSVVSYEKVCLQYSNSGFISSRHVTFSYLLVKWE